MESPKMQFTFSDLVNISLGGKKLTTEHLGILQGLLVVLLNKLNCQNETVCLSGFEGQYLKNISETARDPPYKIHFQNERNFQKHYALLEQLERRAKQMQLQLDNHFDDIRKRCSNNQYKAKFWDFYASPTEDLCTLYSDYNKKFCTMSQNPTFNEEMRRRMTRPVVELMTNFEAQVETMREKLRAINKIADEAAAKLELIEPMIGEIESKRLQIDNQWQSVREAMQETQEMLNCKLDRIALPAMRKYLEHRFKTVSNHIALLMKEPSHCSTVRILDVHKEGICISCSRCDELKPRPLLDLKFPKEKYCKCVVVHKDPTLLERMDKIKVKTYKLVAIPITSSLISYDECSASAITQELRDAGHYVHSYASYNKYRFQDTMELNPLITVVENNRVKSTRRIRSFDPIRSMIAVSGSSSKWMSSTMPNLSITKMKSKLNISRKAPVKTTTNGELKRKSLKVYTKQRQGPQANRPITISSVNFPYMQ